MSRSGESDLRALLANLNPELQEGVYVFCSVAHQYHLPAFLKPLLQFREKGGENSDCSQRFSAKGKS